MGVLVSLPLLACVLAAVCARPLADRLPPRTATWLLTVSTVVLAGASCAAVGLLAMAAALPIPVIAAAGGMSRPALAHLDPAPLALGVAAGGLFACAAMNVLRVAWLRAAALIAVHRQAGRLPGDGQLAVVEDPGVDAYAAPGRRGRIVVTTGMLAVLSDAERDVVLAHERAHASAGHYLFAALARLSAAANPLLRPVSSAIGYSLERWADERAAMVTGSRFLAAQAIAKAALAAADAPPGRAAGAGLAAVPSQNRPRHAGVVPRRIEALLRPPPRRRLALLALAIGVVAVTGFAALQAAGDLHAIIEFAQAAAAS